MFLALLPIIEMDSFNNPCVPTPCGANANCKITNQQASCSCIAGYNGSPPNCRPECVINAECPLNLACINEKCVDPCPGSCGISSLCSVVSHIPICACPTGYVGDPFKECVAKLALQDPSNTLNY